MCPSLVLRLWPRFMDIMRRFMKQVIVDGEGPDLPEWRDWGALFLDGIKILGISLIYGLPAFLFIGGGYAMFFIFDFVIVFRLLLIPIRSTFPRLSS
jgi:hypothetical protein